MYWNLSIKFFFFLVKNKLFCKSLIIKLLSGFMWYLFPITDNVKILSTAKI